jgi:hypothetical protein
MDSSVPALQLLAAGAGVTALLDGSGSLRHAAASHIAIPTLPIMATRALDMGAFLDRPGLSR